MHTRETHGGLNACRDLRVCYLQREVCVVVKMLSGQQQHWLAVVGRGADVACGRKWKEMEGDGT